MADILRAKDLYILGILDWLMKVNLPPLGHIILVLGEFRLKVRHENNNKHVQQTCRFILFFVTQAVILI